MRSVIVGIVIVLLAGPATILAAEQRDGPGESQSLPQQAAATPSTNPTSQPATQFPELAGHRPDEWKSYEAMHAYFVRLFVRSEGNGLSRMPSANDRLRGQRLYASGTRWVVGRVDLISTRKADGVFAYVSSMDNPRQKELQEYKHVDLSDSEKDAVEKIRKGGDEVCMIEGKQPEVIGAIRMQKSCAECHDASEGALLGAFRYPLIRDRIVNARQLQQSGPAPERQR